MLRHTSGVRILRRVPLWLAASAVGFGVVVVSTDLSRRWAWEEAYAQIGALQDGPLLLVVFLAAWIGCLWLPVAPRLLAAALLTAGATFTFLVGAYVGA
jgi:hypothetical protein